MTSTRQGGILNGKKENPPERELSIVFPEFDKRIGEDVFVIIKLSKKKK